MTGKRLSREAVAHLEIGSTAISRPMAWLVSCFFLLVVFSIPLIQYQMDLHASKDIFPAGGNSPAASTGEIFFSRVSHKNTLFLEKIDQLETGIEENSFLRSLFLPLLQSLYLKLLHQGNEKVVVGSDNWLFFRPGVDSLYGRPFLDTTQLQGRIEGHELWEKPVQPDPVEAIVDFNRQLSSRGIKLILLPVPVKASIHPEKLSDYSFSGPPTNRDWNSFLQRLSQEEIVVFDSRPLLYEYAKEHGEAYLQTDTHWLPGAMELIAGELAKRVRQDFSDLQPSADFSLQQLQVEAEGDIAGMLILPPSHTPYLQAVTLKQVVNADNELWQPDPASEILLLGDSFTNIYSTVGLGWGRSGGLAEHLSYHLQHPIDLFARNDSGAFVTREMLGLELARGRDRLAGKNVVIWEFAERELTHGDWKLIDLGLGTSADSSFFVTDGGGQLEVTATVAAVSRSPRPGSVPYRDNIITLHLVDLRGEKGGLEGDQALVYGFGMRDNRLTEMANLRPGDEVRIQLSAWEDVEAEYGSYRRSPLDDEMMELELPNWGTLNHE